MFLPSLKFSKIYQTIFIISIFIVSNANFSRILNCSEYIFESTSSVEFCINPNPAERTWYHAENDCINFGGELISLDTKEKKRYIQIQLTNYTNNSTNTIFVNAHAYRSSISNNNEFTWKSGETLNLTRDKKLAEECVYFSNNLFVAIQCQNLFSIPLMCQRKTQRIYRSSNFSSLEKITEIQIKNDNITCNYSTYGSYKINWFDSKTFCETLTSNSKLIGFPNKNECELINKSLSVEIETMFLNLRPFAYGNNLSNPQLISIDNASRSIFEFVCNRVQKIEKNSNCIKINRQYIYSKECDLTDDKLFKGIICKQCRPNDYQKFGKFILVTSKCQIVYANRY